MSALFIRSRDGTDVEDVSHQAAPLEIDDGDPTRGGSLRRRRAVAIGLASTVAALVIGFIAGALAGREGSSPSPPQPGSALDSAAARQFFGHQPPARTGGPPARNPAAPSNAEAALWPLPPADTVDALANRPATGRGMPIHSIVPDQGVWLGARGPERLFLRLDGSGVTTHQLQVGQKLDVTGIFVRVPDEVQSRFRLGPDDARLLAQQGVYVNALAIQPA